MSAVADRRTAVARVRDPVRHARGGPRAPVAGRVARSHAELVGAVEGQVADHGPDRGRTSRSCRSRRRRRDSTGSRSPAIELDRSLAAGQVMTVGAELALRATFVFTWAEVGARAVGRSLPTVTSATTELMRPWFGPVTVISYVPAATEAGAVTLSRADLADQPNTLVRSRCAVQPAGIPGHIQPDALEERRAAIDRDRDGRGPAGLGHDADGRGAQREGPEHDRASTRRAASRGTSPGRWTSSS